MIKKSFISVLFILFLMPLSAQSQMTMDSIIVNLYSNYRVGSKLESIIKRDGSYFLKLSTNSTEVKFWDDQTKSFLRLDLRSNYKNRYTAKAIETGKRQWQRLYMVYDMFNNFGFEGYYNNEIAQRAPIDFTSAFALAFAYSQKAHNKFYTIYNGVPSELFDLGKKNKMSQKQETEILALVDKVDMLSEKSIGFSKSDVEESQIKSFLQDFKSDMYCMFDVYAKDVNINEWLTDSLYDRESIEFSKNQLIGVKSGDLIFCNGNSGRLQYVQHHYDMAKGALIIPVHLLKHKALLAKIIKSIGGSIPDWLPEYKDLGLLTSFPKKDAPLSEAFKMSLNKLEYQSKLGYYFTYQNNEILIANGRTSYVLPFNLYEYLIIENLKKGDVYWSSYQNSGLKNNLSLDGLLYKLTPNNTTNGKYVTSINGLSSYHKIVNGFEFDTKNMSDEYKQRYIGVCNRTIEALATEGDIKKAQELFKYTHDNFKVNKGNNIQTTVSNIELALSLNLPKYALQELEVACIDLEPGVYRYTRNKNEMQTAILKISSFCKKYDCPEISDVLHQAKIYTSSTVKFNLIAADKYQLSTLTGQPINNTQYNVIQEIRSDQYIVQDGTNWTIIDISGQKLIDENYLSIKNLRGFFMVESKDGFGLLSDTFVTLLPTEFSKITKSSVTNYTKKSNYFIVAKNAKFGLYEIKNESITLVLPIEYTEISVKYPTYFKCVKGNELFYMAYNGVKSTNLNDVTEEEVEIEMIADFDDGYYEKQKEEDLREKVGANVVEKNGLYGIVYVKRTNNSSYSEKFSRDTIPFIYDTIMQGEAYYDWFFAKKNGLWGCVNLKNETLIPFKYKEIGKRHRKTYKNGNPMSFVAVKNKAWGVFACEGHSHTSWKLGKEVCPTDYDSIAYKGEAGFLIWKNGKVGAFSTTYPYKITPPIYKSYKGINKNYLQPVYTFVDENDKEVRVYSGGELVE